MSMVLKLKHSSELPGEPIKTWIARFHLQFLGIFIAKISSDADAAVVQGSYFGNY
jgi:hypothetical protein